MIGVVQKYSNLEGYGWLLVGFRQRVFFHISQWRGQQEPKVGERVTFEMAPPHKAGQGQQAANVTPAVDGAQ